MTTGSYFFDDGQARKFWSYSVSGKKQTIRHGRIGTAGRESVKIFASTSEAKEAIAKLINQKISKDYIKVEPGKLRITRPKGKRKATSAQVAKLEKQLGFKLPTDYKEFLLTQNGGESNPGEIKLPGDKEYSIPVGFIYGLYAKSEPFKSLQFGIDKILPLLPEGHLPISGLFNLHYFSISLDRKPGCVYYWDEDAGDEYNIDENGQTIFDDSNAVLVAGSFDEFLTRIATYEVQSEQPQPAVEKTNSKSTQTKKSQKAKRSKLSKKRQQEILRLTEEGGEDLSAAIDEGEKAISKFLREIRKEITSFLKTSTNKHELHFFAENYHWEGNLKPMPILDLVKNPNVDAGTLLKLYWYGCPEDYYLFHKSESEIDDEFERQVFRALRRIEKRIVKADYKTASIPFDPTDSISMSDRKSEFARQIPDIMYQPNTGRKRK